VDHFTPTFRGQKPKVDQKMSDLELRSADLPPTETAQSGPPGDSVADQLESSGQPLLSPPQPLPGTAWLPLQRPS
jgi:hypothetical protein